MQRPLALLRRRQDRVARDARFDAQLPAHLRAYAKFRRTEIRGAVSNLRASTRAEGITTSDHFVAFMNIVVPGWQTDRPDVQSWLAPTQEA